MKIDLPSGGWVECRERLGPGDRFAIQDGPDVIVEEGRTVVRNAASNSLRGFLARIVTAWSFPGDPAVILGSAKALDEIFDIDDWDKLERDTQPLFEKARPPQVPNTRGPSRPSSPQSEITSAS